MRGMFSRIAQSLKLPALSFFLAFTISGLLIALSDAKVLEKIGSPIEFLKAALSSVGNAYLSLFQGAIYDSKLASGKNFFQGFYPLSETIVI